MPCAVPTKLRQTDSRRGGDAEADDFGLSLRRLESGLPRYVPFVVPTGFFRVLKPIQRCWGHTRIHILAHRAQTQDEEQITKAFYLVLFCLIGGRRTGKQEATKLSVQILDGYNKVTFDLTTTTYVCVISRCSRLSVFFRPHFLTRCLATNGGIWCMTCSGMWCVPRGWGVTNHSLPCPHRVLARC